MISTQRKLRYVVVGAGNIAQVAILPAFAHAGENSELVGIVSSDTEKRDVLGQRYGLTHLSDYDGLEQLLSDSRADVVYIAVPNSMHRQITERAARVGVHVLCEKPMAETVDDCQAMINVCKEHDVRLMIAYRLHFEPATLSAIALAQSGKLGDLRVFSSVFSQDVRDGDVRTQGELAGGALYDMGVYPINAVRNLFCEEPVEVLASCQTGDARFHEVDATTTAILRFPEGRVAQVTASLTASSVSTYHLIGTLGDLLVEPAFDYSRPLHHRITIAGQTTSHTFPLGDQFAPEIVYFSSCVREGREPEPSGEEGLADVRIVRAIFRSAETGKAVVLTPFSRSHRAGISQAMHAPPVAEVTPVNAPAPTGS